MIPLQPIIESIPVELKKLDQWVVWRLEEVKGKLTKVPYQSGQPSRRSSAGNPKTWGTYESAVAAYRNKALGFSGIGFNFSENDLYFGVDLDDCIDSNGELLPWASEIVHDLNTYTEISPSGKGLKLIGKGYLTQMRHKNGGKEAYDKKRYFTITGHLLNEYPSSPPLRSSPRSARGLGPTLRRRR